MTTIIITTTIIGTATPTVIPIARIVVGPRLCTPTGVLTNIVVEFCSVSTVLPPVMVVGPSSQSSQTVE